MCDMLCQAGIVIVTWAPLCVECGQAWLVCRFCVVLALDVLGYGQMLNDSLSPLLTHSMHCALSAAAAAAAEETALVCGQTSDLVARLEARAALACRAVRVWFAQSTSCATQKQCWISRVFLLRACCKPRRLPVVSTC